MSREQGTSAADSAAMPDVEGPNVCYGFAAQAPFPLRTARSGAGAPLRISVDEVPVPRSQPLFEWSELGMPFARLWAGDAHVLWLDGLGCFSVEPSEGAIAVPPTVEPLRREASLWSFPTLLCLLARGDLGIHAAAVEVDGRALVLAAPGMHGKTTLAAAFAAGGHRMLSEDLTCIHLGDGQPTILPGPALMKLRRDTFEHLQVPSELVLAEFGRRIYVTQSDVGTAAPVPLAGIVLLRRSSGSPALTPVDAHRTLPDLWTLSFKLPDDADRARCFDQISGVAASVPLWDLHRPLSYDLLPKVLDLVRSTVGA